VDDKHRAGRYTDHDAQAFVDHLPLCPSVRVRTRTTNVCVLSFEGTFLSAITAAGSCRAVVPGAPVGIHDLTDLLPPGTAVRSGRLSRSSRH